MKGLWVSNKMQTERGFSRKSDILIRASAWNHEIVI